MNSLLLLRPIYQYEGWDWIDYRLRAVVGVVLMAEVVEVVVHVLSCVDFKELTFSVGDLKQVFLCIHDMLAQKSRHHRPIVEATVCLISIGID